MSKDSELVNVGPAQFRELNRELSRLRHQVNNHLSLMLAAAEMIQRKPQATQQYVARLMEQPPKISDELEEFSRKFEQTFGLKKDEDTSPPL